MSDLSSTGGVEGWLKKADRRLRTVEGGAMKARIPRLITSLIRPDVTTLQPGVRLFETDTNRSIEVNADSTGYIAQATEAFATTAAAAAAAAASESAGEEEARIDEWRGAVFGSDGSVVAGIACCCCCVRPVAMSSCC